MTCYHGGCEKYKAIFVAKCLYLCGLFIDVPHTKVVTPQDVTELYETGKS